MKMAKRALLIVGITVAIAALVEVVIIILDGNSGGPVIVIEPDPDPPPQGATITLATKWSLAWCDSTTPVSDIGKLYDPPRMSHHLDGIVGIDDIVVKFKNGSPSIGPDVIGRIDMWIGSDKLSLKRSKKHAEPTWMWNDKTIKAKYWRKANEIESPMLQQITKVAISDFAGNPLPDRSVSEIKAIEIYYDQNPLYGCP
jgi:hypothetical protein